MKKRTVYRIEKAGDLKKLNRIEEPVEAPGRDDVVVEVRAIGLNFADIFAVLGLYSATPKGSFIPGLEYAGIISEAGADVKNVKVGDQVMGVTRFGAYASHVTVDQQYVMPLPQDWSFTEGASMLVQALTAYYGLVELGDLKKDQTVLIHSAAGGVGIWAGRIAKSIGAHTIGTVGSESKFEILKKEGYDQMLVRSNSFYDDLKQLLAGKELNLVMECIGGQIFKDSYKAMAPMGRLISYGSAHFGFTGNRPNYLKLFLKYLRRPRLDPLKMIRENKAVMAFNLIYLYDHADLMHEMMNTMMKMELGKPYVGQEFGFDALPEALRAFQTGKTTGKVVINL